MNEVLSVPLFWQQPQWVQLHQNHQAGCLAHALLFTGQAGLGKGLLAASFSKTLLCKQALASVACNHCRDCLLVAANTHPDLSYVVPEHANQGIKIDQIRRIIHQLNQTTSSPYKIVIIDPADSLLVASSNALLKSLEEPTVRTLFILITDKPGLLLPTIRSRCQLIRFTVPEQSAGKAWLRAQLPNLAVDSPHTVDRLYDLADAAPLQALAYAKTGLFEWYQSLLDILLQLAKREVDPIKLAESYLKADGSTLLHCLMKIVSAVLKCQFQRSECDLEVEGALHGLANILDSAFLFDYFDQLLDCQRHAKIALNLQLMLEDLFCAWFLQGDPC